MTSLDKILDETLLGMRVAGDSDGASWEGGKRAIWLVLFSPSMIEPIFSVLDDRWPKDGWRHDVRFACIGPTTQTALIEWLKGRNSGEDDAKEVEIVVAETPTAGSVVLALRKADGIA